MPLLNAVINWINYKRNYQIELFREHPDDIQKETLLNLLNKSKNTEWGKLHKYNEIRSTQDFQEAVPLQTDRKSVV